MIGLVGTECLADSVASLFGVEPVAYSGVILGDDGASSSGECIEKSCYARGGYKFMLRDFGWMDEIDRSVHFDTIVPLLAIAAADYAESVLGRPNVEVATESLWAVCQREGDYATIHHHIPPGELSGNRISGMLYLCSPEGVNPSSFPNGCLHFIVNGVVVYCPPVPGSLVLWPSELLHGVHPFRGPGDRLGVSFNLVLN